MSSITLLGLEKDLADSLARLLRQEHHEVFVTNSLADALGRPSADVLFAGGDAPDYRGLIREVRRALPGLHVIVVNRFPDNTRWLDALEMGAADYCGAPFEAVQVRWLMDTANHSRPKLAVA